MGVDGAVFYFALNATPCKPSSPGNHPIPSSHPFHNSFSVQPTVQVTPCPSSFLLVLFHPLVLDPYNFWLLICVNTCPCLSHHDSVSSASASVLAGFNLLIDTPLSLIYQLAFESYLILIHYATVTRSRGIIDSAGS
jgi:hypothetical protein